MQIAHVTYVERSPVPGDVGNTFHAELTMATMELLENSVCSRKRVSNDLTAALLGLPMAHAGVGAHLIAMLWVATVPATLSLLTVYRIM